MREMFALRVTFRTGRYRAARFEDGDAKTHAEWPPHPARLFSAFAAAWGETGASDDGRRLLEWLERLDPPRLIYSDCMERENVTHYVPVNDSNDQFHRTKGSFFQAISEAVSLRRDRKERRFPSSTPDLGDVFFLWREELPDSHRVTLGELLKFVPSLGHSSSMVGISLEDDVPAEVREAPNIHEIAPDMRGMIQLRVPSAGRLEQLERSFQKFMATPEKTNRPTAGKLARYRRVEPVEPEAVQSIFGEMLVLRRKSGDRLPLVSTQQLTAAFRGAIQSQFGPNAVPEFISGHAPESTPEQTKRSEHPHLAYIPLPDVGHDHARGHIMGVAALLPRTFTREEEERCVEAVANVERLTMARAGAWEVEAGTVQNAARALLPQRWIGPSRQWATVTPFVFDRHPRKLFDEEGRQIVAKACRRVGLPEPSSIFLVKVSPHIGVPVAPNFPSAPARPGKPQRRHLHLILSFNQDVLGPVVIGAGRYYGYGLCGPLN
jgi:CRISPR-associated protein Csb2